MIEKLSVPLEEGIYGERWPTLHEGYFADPEVASSFLDIIEKFIGVSHPAVIADLGGGTGFILHELLRRQHLSGIRLVNVDISPKQLRICNDKQISAIQVSASQFTRQQLQVEDGMNLMLIARSLLHYFGRFGIIPLLRHLRHQIKEGEFFIHQSACFQHSEDAECLNSIYRLMGTDKWYGTIREMKTLLEEEGWEINSESPARNLHLSSKDLSERYGLNPQEIRMVQKEVEKQYGQKPDVFIRNDDGFDAWLHYCIFVCRAI
jgi:SAM-dependent methyltransferase